MPDVRRRVALRAFAVAVADGERFVEYAHEFNSPKHSHARGRPGGRVRPADRSAAFAVGCW
jgi:hypothetical protein